MIKLYFKRNGKLINFIKIAGYYNPHVEAVRIQMMTEREIMEQDGIK
jgi:ribosomal protein S16